jgi:hypothetical protein
MILLLSLASYYSKYPRLIEKLNFQFLLILICIDLIWLFVMSSVWNHDNDENKEYWKSLSTMHNIVYFLVWIEILIKCGLGFLFFNSFSKNGQNSKNLFNFYYKNLDGITSNSENQPTGKTSNY